MNRPIRVLVAKPGLDGHDRGALIVAQGLRDAGMEVIYTGLRQTVSQIVAAAVDEDVDCIGLSSLSGAHMSLFPAIMDELKKEGANDILVVGGGVIPPADGRALKLLGIAEIFTPGSTIEEMADFIRGHVRRDRGSTDRELVLPAHALQAIDHIGLAVQNLDEALRFYRDHLGMQVVHEEVIPEQQVRATFLQIGDTHLELLESTSDQGPIARFIAKRGPGVHHVAYRVDSVSEWLDRARIAGLKLIDDAPRMGGQHKLIAFVHPVSAQGVLTEYCQIVQE
ncbi:MAG: methylmalonyl-CoA epimerase [Bacilli bacterium]